MAKKKRKIKVPEEATFEVRPLPPHHYEKTTTWSTPDGLPPVPVYCKVSGCPDLTIYPPLCESHLYVLAGSLRSRLIIKVNGSNNGR